MVKTNAKKSAKYTMVNELTSCFPYTNTLCLLDVYDNKIYPFDIDVKSSGIKNGAVLAFI